MTAFCIEEIIGDGWHPVEQQGNSRLVWSSKTAVLNFPRQHEGFNLDFSGCPGRLYHYSIEYNDKHVCEGSNYFSPFRINIPVGIDSCLINLDEEWIPGEVFDSPDKRKLGICLKNVQKELKYSTICDWYPHTLELGLIGKCNINPPCVMCITRNSKRNQKIPDISETIYQKMKPVINYTSVVSLHGAEGEPLLSPRLLDLLDYIDNEKVYTRFSSNGLLLSKDKSDRLISAGLKEINISIDAASPSTYQKIRNNNGFQKVVNNIKTLTDLMSSREALYPQVIINMVLMKENFREFPDFIDMAHDLGVSSVHVRLLVPQFKNYEVKTDFFHFNYFDQRIDPTSAEFKHVLDESLVRAEKYKIKIISDNPEITSILEKENKEIKTVHKIKEIRLSFRGSRRKFVTSNFINNVICDNPWENALVDVYGNVKFCCHSIQVLGNLKEQDFRTIWNGKTAKNIRKKFLKNKLPDNCIACPIHCAQEQVWQQVENHIPRESG